MSASRGRPSKGVGARSKIRSVRLTPQELAVLEARFGTGNKALRHLVDAYLRDEGGHHLFRSTKSVPGDDSPAPPA